MTRRAWNTRGAPSLPFTLALAAIALLPRLYVAVAWAKEPVWDGHYYHFGAERIAQGLGYSEDVWLRGELVWKPWVHYPIGYSALLAAVYALVGSGLLVAPLVNALIGTALVVLSYRLARRHLSEGRAQLAGALVALHPGLIVYGALVMSEPLAALLLVATGLVALSARAAVQAGWMSGVLLGLATLVRPTSLLVAPLVGLVRQRPWQERAVVAAIAFGAALACVLPWTIRNCNTLDGCALVSTNGGWNLAIGTITKTGRFETLRASDGCRVVTGQVQQDRCWAAVGWRKISDKPVAWLGKIPDKLAETLNHESFAIEYLHEADPVSWPEARRSAGRELLSGFHRALLLVATLGVLAWPRRGSAPAAAFVQGGLVVLTILIGAYGFVNEEHPFHWLAPVLVLAGLVRLPGSPPLGSSGRYLVGLIAITLATHALFFGEDRYHLVLSPLLCILAAGALRRSAVPAGAPRVLEIVR